ncbi:MAG: helix-hairpin-helix domain-containing protein [Actinomycetota bacterium]
MSWSARAVRALAIVLGVVVLAVGYTWWQGRARPVVEMPDPSPSASTALTDIVTVHVIGRVRRPGVVTLPFGSRVADAVAASGGLKPGASSGDLNLARVLVDGEQVIVGERRRTSAEATEQPGEPAGALLDLNTASAAALEELPGVGPVLAGRIVAWREDNGPFPSVEILGEVSGIGDALLSQLRPLVRV